MGAKAVVKKQFASFGRDESGQAAIEYVLILSVIVAAYMAFITAIEKAHLAETLMGPIVGSYAMTYKYGNPKAKGFDEGTPENHPRAVVDGKVRLFINPR
jgi:Flp pilus assembly pilin Flp